MSDQIRFPKPGDRLVHRYRKRPGQVTATVISADPETGRVEVRVGDKNYPSLSSAATALSDSEMNGWVFWGLKKQKSRKQKR